MSQMTGTEGNSRDYSEQFAEILNFVQYGEGERIMCKFCEALAEEKECHGIAQRWATDAELTEYGKWMVEYTAAIVKRNWYEKKGKKSADRTVVYRNNGLGFALNYCPECGKKTEVSE